MENTFRSPRLLYRAPHFPDDEPYFMARQHDLLSQSQSHPGLLKPGSKTGMENHSKWLETCLLAVIVCLPFGNKEKGEDATNKGDGKDGKEAKSGTPSSTPIPIGDITLSGAPPAFAHHRRSEIGIVLLPEWQGMGYGSEAIEWICGWGFRIAGLHRIGIGGHCKRATDLYARLGFVEEGRRRDFIWLDGEWYDLVQLGMLESEWRAKTESKRLEESN